MLNNVIIFEGQDRCLKSTIINRLIQTDAQHYYHTLHYGKPPKIDNVKEYQETTYRKMFQMLSSDNDFILDRSHLGEMIWSPIYRNYESIPAIQKMEKRWYNNNKLEKNIFLFILVDSNFENWSTRDDRQGLNNGDKEKHMLEVERFKNSLNLTCVEKKYCFDLKYWYLENSNRINDTALFNQIYTIITS